MENLLSVVVPINWFNFSLPFRESGNLGVDGDQVGFDALFLFQLFQNFIEGVQSIRDGAFEMDVVGSRRFAIFPDIGFEVQNI